MITNTDAEANTQGPLAREALARQVCAPVRWVETMQCIVSQDIQAVVEVGPKKTLSGLMRRFNKDVECYQTDNLEALMKTVAALKQN